MCRAHVISYETCGNLEKHVDDPEAAQDELKGTKIYVAVTEYRPWMFRVSADWDGHTHLGSAILNQMLRLRSKAMCVDAEPQGTQRCSEIEPVTCDNHQATNDGCTYALGN